MAVITSPISGTSITATSLDHVMGLLYQDLNSFTDRMANADISFRYPEFERDYGEFGARLHSTRFLSPQSQAVNKNTTAICGPYYNDAVTYLFGTWTEKFYPWETRRVDLTKVVRGEAEYSEVVQRIIESLSQGFRGETNTAIENTLLGMPTPTTISPLLIPGATGTSPISLADFGENGFLMETADLPSRVEILGAGSTSNSPVTYKDVYTRIMQVYYNMMKESFDYVGIAPVSGMQGIGTSDRDLSIYLPTDFLASADMQFLNRLTTPNGLDKLPAIKKYWVSNTTKAKLQAPYATGDTDKVQYHVAYILDNRVINHVTRYRAFEENPVGCRFSDQHALHIEDGIWVDNLYPAYAIVFPQPVESLPNL